MAEDPKPGPDPGNSGPESWSEKLHPSEIREAVERLSDEFGRPPRRREPGER